MSSRVVSKDQPWLIAKAAQERDVVDEVMALLDERGLFHAKTDASKYFVDGQWRSAKISVAGWPDITALLPDGRFLGIECKRRGSKARPSQEWCAKAVRFSRGVYLVVDGVDKLALELDRLLAESAENIRILAEAKGSDTK